MPLRVVVVDDQLPFRVALRRVLQRAGIDVVAECSDGADALAVVAQLTPDIVVLDVRMPGMDGPAAARAIAEQWPDMTVLLCSSHSRDDLPTDLPAPFVPKELLTASALQDAVQNHVAPL